MKIGGNIVDIEQRRIYFGEVVVCDGCVAAVNELGEERKECNYIMLGFIDSHVHTESSQLTPSNFGQMVISCGTVGVVTDPHEIANVLGVEGVEFMIESAKSSPMRIYFSIPSSVPATPFDRSGGVISVSDVKRFVESERFVALSEVMNVPGVLGEDEDLMQKISIVREAGLAVDGHAPMLMGESLLKYAKSGISTDHECSTIEEAQQKIDAGMKIQIREGSAAKNYEALKQLIATSPESLLFCTDDSHPADILSTGEIDKIVRRAVADGFDLFDVLRIASINPKRHYNLPQGGLTVGEEADFIVVDNLTNFKTQQLYIRGELRYDIAQPSSTSDTTPTRVINNFNHDRISVEELKRSVVGGSPIDVIGVIPDEIITRHDHYTPRCDSENLESDLQEDVAKIVYVNRYYNTPPVVAYCRGFGLKRGAIASSIAHDSHNITAIGMSDHDIAEAINGVIENRGAFVVCHDSERYELPLPIAGIISDRSAEAVIEANHILEREIVKMGCPLAAPFMTLAFMSLIVVPELKIGEKGLFSYSRFDWI